MISGFKTDFMIVMTVLILLMRINPYMHAGRFVSEQSKLYKLEKNDKALKIILISKPISLNL